MNKRLRKKLTGRVGGHHPAWFTRRLRKDLNVNPPGFQAFCDAYKGNYNEALDYAVYKAYGHKAADKFTDALPL